MRHLISDSLTYIHNIDMIYSSTHIVEPEDAHSDLLVDRQVEDV